MAKMYDNPINENTPWDGDESTGNLPVRGRRIEEFLKSQLKQKVNDSTLAQKAGVFYLDEEQDKYLIFADEKSRDEYLADQSKTELLLGEITGMSEEQKEQLSDSIKSINVRFDNNTKGVVIEYEKHNTPTSDIPSVSIPTANENFSGLMSSDDKKQLKKLSESIDINPITDEEIKDIFNKS